MLSLRGAIFARKILIMETTLKTPNAEIAYCGLFCSNCSKYKKQKCPGCSKNEKATWCKIRLCCIEKEIETCAGCAEFSHVKECPKYNNVFARLIELVSRTDRSLCVEMLRSEGTAFYVDAMNASGKMSMPKEKK